MVEDGTRFLHEADALAVGRSFPELVARTGIEPVFRSHPNEMIKTYEYRHWRHWLT